jgi:uncharacterized protein (UPF0335 family)
MAEKAKPSSQAPDPKFVTRIENLERQIEGLRDDIKEEVKVLREDIKQVYDEAEDNGVPKAALRAVLKARSLEKKAKAARDKLDPFNQDRFDLIRHALGDLADTPLGAATLEAAA